MLNEKTVRLLKIAFEGLQTPLGAASLENGFLTNDAALSNAVNVAKRAYQEIPAGDWTFIPCEDGIPADIDHLFERIDKVLWYLNNNETSSNYSLTQYLDETKQLLDRIVKRIP